MSTIRFSTFPRTIQPPGFVRQVVTIFEQHEREIGTVHLPKGLTSAEVLDRLRADLIAIGFEVEQGKREEQKIKRPVFFGENAEPSLQYEVDGWHPQWRVGIEIEAGRAWMGNAVYRDLIQALVMVNLDHLLLAVPNVYRYRTNERDTSSNDYLNTVAVAEALFGHSRVKMPFTLCVIGY
jgi:hypothetical protein